jgi:hypothetical protein
MLQLIGDSPTNPDLAGVRQRLLPLMEQARTPSASLPTSEDICVALRGSSQ